MSPRKSTSKIEGGQLDRGQHILRGIVLFLGALVFLFPFYYMIIGSLQKSPDPTVAGAFPNPANLTLDNYTAINSRVDLVQGLINSGIFTGGVIIGTVVFGVLVGYALAQLQWRGRGVTFALALLVQVVPFQLLMIPLYVLIARDYGLADNYLGMILPFAINSTAVIIFRQYFLQVPRELFDAARIDGAGELVLLWKIALPLVRPALLTVILLTFIGPWNEFLWPFLITKEASMQPLAVSLANYISTVAASAANPFGAVLAGACVLAGPAVLLFILFQKHFVATNIGSGVKG
ncbi:carbohydrate ABC transporter permease [Cryobacterium melibiosiphilum]|uniref:Carbohydrate ABC transporter permease n=1 Tax=Cryobacterium melibiosiphilum TaxID=995039 RepID=A0A3A5MI51_9MICO|nr:carbohydrate ABC transporter permease [Cryobacterium melibiosiphilum]RJT88735.1 carbohydrate ABC transporter permease [Cryobacterium melibiosiphilum]